MMIYANGSAASAQAFSAPVPLSTSVYHLVGGISTGFEINSVRSAIDDAGTALVTWFDNGKYYYTERPANGAWSAPAIINGSKALGAKVKSSQLLVSPAGMATLITYIDPPSNTGSKEQIYQASIWYQDKAPGGTWSTPRLVVNNATLVTFEQSRIRLVMNQKGDQAIVFQQTHDGNATNQITAIRRPAGGGWGAQSTVANSAPPATNLHPDSAVLGNNGDLIVTYSLDGYEAVCGSQNYCYFTPHVARQTVGTTAWIDTALAHKGMLQYATDAVIDDNGRAAVLVKGGPTPFFRVTRQLKAGARWSSFVNTPLPNILKNNDFTYEYTSFEKATALGEAGALGQASFHALATDDVLDGNIIANSWIKTPSPVGDPNDPNAGFFTRYDFNAKGGALVSRAYDSTSTLCGTSVSIRNTTADAWSAPQSLVFNVNPDPAFSNSCYRNSGKINDSGQAVMIFITESYKYPDINLTLYAATR